jgi:EAL domain-containing protein (putative c-di-GMP-specific phosphodiesterase class I)/GGDEF domain-containing protein
MYDYLKKEIERSKEYTLILFSVDNLYEINSRYGIQNGDKVLFETLNWIAEYLKLKGIDSFPIGRVKGGDFIIGLNGSKSQYKIVVELMCLKSEDLKIDDIEIRISGAINDTQFSKDIDYLIENLFKLQEKNKNYKQLTENIDEEINPNELEYSVINAIKRRDLVIYTQSVFEKDIEIFKECFVKLRREDLKLIHQKNYMKVLDKLRLMSDYDLIVLEKVTKLCESSKDGIFAIQISPTSIRNFTVLTKIKEIFTKNRCVKNRIILIFNESEYYPRIEKFNAILQQLKDLGILIGLDRLGSLHTSFLYLRDLDIDIVRFDSYYTKESYERENRNIIGGFNVMAHEKGVKTWIKMVESQKSYTLAKELNVDYLQGRYLSPLEKN